MVDIINVYSLIYIRIKGISIEERRKKEKLLKRINLKKEKLGNIYSKVIDHLE